MQNAGWIKGEGVFIPYNIWKLERKKRGPDCEYGVKLRVLTLVKGSGCEELVVIFSLGRQWDAGCLRGLWGCRTASADPGVVLWGQWRFLEPCQCLENLLPLSAAAAETLPWSLLLLAEFAQPLLFFLSWMCSTLLPEFLLFWLQSWGNPGIWAWGATHTNPGSISRPWWRAGSELLSTSAPRFSQIPVQQHSAKLRNRNPFHQHWLMGAKPSFLQTELSNCETRERGGLSRANRGRRDLHFCCLVLKLFVLMQEWG